MRFTITEPAEPQTVFAADAFDNQIGKTIPITIGTTQTDGKLVAATVADDGRSVELTVEVDTPPSLDPIGLLSMSFAFRTAPRRDEAQADAALPYADWPGWREEWRPSGGAPE